MSLQSLLERVEKAEGPDREIEEAIAEALVWPKFKADGWVMSQPGYWLSPLAIEMDDDDKGWFKVPAYTASLDAAVALVEKMLHGCDWNIGTQLGGIFWAEIIDAKVGTESGFGKNPALALLAALLRALIAKEESNVTVSPQQR